MNYFATHPSLLREFKENKICFGLLNTKLFELAEAEGYSFERFSHLDILHTPIWVDENKPVKNWKFNETYRIKE